jgi:hypothetical protein
VQKTQQPTKAFGQLSVSGELRKGGPCPSSHSPIAKPHLQYRSVSTTYFFFISSSASVLGIPSFFVGLCIEFDEALLQFCHQSFLAFRALFLSRDGIAQA